MGARGAVAASPGAVVCVSFCVCLEEDGSGCDPSRNFTGEAEDASGAEQRLRLVHPTPAALPHTRVTEVQWGETNMGVWVCVCTCVFVWRWADPIVQCADSHKAWGGFQRQGDIPH